MWDAVPDKAVVRPAWSLRSPINSVSLAGVYEAVSCVHYSRALALTAVVAEGLHTANDG